MSNYQESIIVLKILSTSIKAENNNKTISKLAIFAPKERKTPLKTLKPLPKLRTVADIKFDIKELIEQKTILDQRLNQLKNLLENKNYYIKQQENAKYNIENYKNYLNQLYNSEQYKNAKANNQIIKEEIIRIENQIKQKHEIIDQNIKTKEEVETLKVSLKEKQNIIKTYDEIFEEEAKTINYIKFFENTLKNAQNNIKAIENIDLNEFKTLEEQIEDINFDIAGLQVELEEKTYSSGDDLQNLLEEKKQENISLNKIQEEEIFTPSSIKDKFVTFDKTFILEDTKEHIEDINSQMYSIITETSNTNQLNIKDKYKKIYSLIGLYNQYKEKIEKNEDVTENKIKLQNTYNKMMSEMSKFPELKNLVLEKQKLENLKSQISFSINKEIELKNSLISTNETERPITFEEIKDKLKKYYESNKSYYINKISDNCFQYITKYLNHVFYTKAIKEFLIIPDDETINLEHGLLTPKELESFKGKITINKNKLEEFVKFYYNKSFSLQNYIIENVMLNIEPEIQEENIIIKHFQLKQHKELFIEIFFGVIKNQQISEKKYLFSPIPAIIKLITRKLEKVIHYLIEEEKNKIEQIKSLLQIENNKLKEEDFENRKNQIEENYKNEREQILNSEISEIDKDVALDKLNSYKNYNMSRLLKQDPIFIEKLQSQLENLEKNLTNEQAINNLEVEKIKPPSTSRLINATINTLQYMTGEKKDILLEDVKNISKEVFNYVYNNKNTNGLFWTDVKRTNIKDKIKIFNLSDISTVFSFKLNEQNINQGIFTMFFCVMIFSEETKEKNIISFGKLVIQTTLKNDGTVESSIITIEPPIIDNKFAQNNFRANTIRFSIMENVISKFIRSSMQIKDRKEIMLNNKNQIIKTTVEKYKSHFTGLSEEKLITIAENTFRDLFPINIKESRLKKIQGIRKLAYFLRA